MKRTIGIIAALLMTAMVGGSAAAQGTGAIKGGFSYGNVSNTGVLPGSVSGRSGFAAGVAVGDASRPIGIGVEMLYAQRGVESSANAGTRRLDYIDVPLYLRLAAPAPISPYAYAGPQASFELRCRMDGERCPDTGRPSRSYSAVIGAGVRLGARRGVSVEGRYVYGLTDLKLSTVTAATSYSTRSFAVLIGVGF